MNPLIKKEKIEKNGKTLFDQIDENIRMIQLQRGFTNQKKWGKKRTNPSSFKPEVPPTPKKKPHQRIPLEAQDIPSPLKPKLEDANWRHAPEVSTKHRLNKAFDLLNEAAKELFFEDKPEKVNIKHLEEIDQMDDEIMDLKGRNEELEDELEEERKKYKESEDARRLACRHHIVLNKRINTLENEMKQDKRIMRTLHSDLTKTNIEHNDLVFEFEDAKKLLEDAKKLVDEMADENENLRVQLDDLKKEKECIVCMDKPREMLLWNCNHFVTCRECTDKLTECPVCREMMCRAESVYFA